MALTAKRICKLKPLHKPKTYGSGRGGFGFMLRVLPTGTKDWMQSIRIDGKRCNLGLGACPAITLTDARRRALE